MNTFNPKFLLDTDSNPIIVFSESGKIIYINDSAEILMGYVPKKEIFDLALNYAPKDYGSKTTQLELSFGHLNFYSISVGYLSDEWISIRLYYRPLTKKYFTYKKEDQTPTDINKMLSVAIHQFTIDKDIDIKLFTDTDIPQITLNQNSFLKLLRKTLSLFRVNKFLDITLKLNIGEHIIIEQKPYKIVILKFESNGRYCDEDKNIDELANELFIVSSFKENSITFEIPLITQ